MGTSMYWAVIIEDRQLMPETSPTCDFNHYSIFYIYILYSIFYILLCTAQHPPVCSHDVGLGRSRTAREIERGIKVMRCLLHTTYYYVIYIVVVN